MSLAEVPVVLILIGLAAYAVLAGADFGAGFWQLLPGPRERAHAQHAIGPVWEANHVWLIFVIVVCWTAYPKAFGSIASTLAVPLFIAAIGIIMRGTTYALRSGTSTPREERVVEVLFAVSSILTPFALGSVVGGIASGRVPVGNAAGSLWSSWLNLTSITIGVLAVATAAYLAAVYLAADAERLQQADLERTYRSRALVMAVVAGAVALLGLVVVHHDAHRIWSGLTSGAGLGAVVVSALAGCGTMLFVLRSRYGWARVSAALAVAAIVAGWGLAQRPLLLPGLTIDQAAASRSTIVALLVSLAIGAVVLIPSLALLFGLVLRGRFDREVEGGDAAVPANPRERSFPLVPLALACLVVGVLLDVPLDSRWGRILGIPLLFAFVVLGSLWLARSTVSGVASSGDQQPPPV
jgi:cytochrome bd ubiquinol oxidase subunit II